MSRPGSAASVRNIDPRQPTRLNIKLGRTLLDENADGISGIAFNHKPSQTSNTRNTSIAQTGDGYTLTINDHDDNDDNKTQYKGNRWSTPHSYILTLDADGTSFVLDELEFQYAFNLVSAPWEKDAEKLAAQYKQIPVQPENDIDTEITGDEEGLFEEEDSGPDPDNPFDYRHYLNGLPDLPGEHKAASTAGTPLLAASRATTSLKPALARRLSDHSRQPQKPRTAQTSRPPPPPQVRLERRASAKRSSPVPSEPEEEDDDGDLVIDMGEGYQPKKKSRTLLTPFTAGRPISLRSAAASASPALSAMHSPAQRDAGAGSGYEEDDEGEGDEVDEMDVDGEAEVEHESNEDVDELALDSPVPLEDKTAPVARRQSTWDADEEAELQAKLEQALEDEFDEDEEEAVQAPIVHVQAQESEEESEEE